ncbi:MAG: hypothetical protein JRN62_04215 [Nitrososphaerota archaeon]|jgi:N-glycosylase/DNA lyase|nr:hypothetical protein [Nitrososphaerota archaeon]MDG6948808.1 hypothetical protein [Nitrososphaerota archaeon]
MPRSGWTTVAVSEDTVKAIKGVANYANVSSFAREAIEEKLERMKKISDAPPKKHGKATKLTVIGKRDS